MNRLHDATSPYLRQHLDNPVHWWTWCDAAFDEARKRNCPVIISIGYSACHWCHVMAHESFEDDEVAALMNQHFVSIKVDREERPDIDAIYMDALHALGEQGGWPLTMFAAPDRKPIWGGTYFPKHSKYGRPGFMDVLLAVRKTWDEDPDRITHNTAALTDFLRQKNTPRSNQPDFQTASAFTANLLSIQDNERGGIKGAPKFPNAPLLDALWMAWLADGNAAARDAFHRTITALCRGGIFDHIGGGLARYSTDAKWLVPHFEKMLYDNAHFLRHLAWAHADNNNRLYAHCAKLTVGWLEREMLTPSGTFASSLDADSEGVEGKFYIWSKDEIGAILGPTCEAFCQTHDVTEAGNWEGHNILNLSHLPNAEIPQALERFEKERSKLLNARDQRIRPGRDDKVLTDWNGLMIEALAIAAPVFSEPRWLDMAEAALDALQPRNGGTLCHAQLNDRQGDAEFLSDHAALLNAHLALAQTGRRSAPLSSDGKFIERFLDQAKTPLMAPAERTDTPVPPLAIQDEANPSGGSQALLALTRLNTFAPTNARNDLIEAIAQRSEVLLAVSSHGAGSHQAFRMLEQALSTLVLLGPENETAKWRDRLLALGRPDLIIQTSRTPADLPSDHPARTLPDEAHLRAALCQNQTCHLPMTNFDALLSTITLQHSR